MGVGVGAGVCVGAGVGVGVGAGVCVGAGVGVVAVSDVASDGAKAVGVGTIATEVGVGGPPGPEQAAANASMTASSGQAPRRVLDRYT